MTVSAMTIEIGKCYVTGLSERLRVVAAGFSNVEYEFLDDASKETVTVSREKFAAEVDREISCPD